MISVLFVHVMAGMFIGVLLFGLSSPPGWCVISPYTTVLPLIGGFFGFWQGTYEDARLSIKEGKKPRLFLSPEIQGLIDGLCGAWMGFHLIDGIALRISYRSSYHMIPWVYLTLGLLSCLVFFVLFFILSKRASTVLHCRLAESRAATVREIPPISPPVNSP